MKRRGTPTTYQVAFRRLEINNRHAKLHGKH